MTNANFYIAISGRVLSTPRRYFTGFLIDRETDTHRYDIVLKERREIDKLDALPRDARTKQNHRFCEKGARQGFRQAVGREFQRLPPAVRAVLQFQENVAWVVRRRS